MTKIVCAEDCGNAPKKQYIKDFNIAFAKADVKEVLSMLTDDAEWEIVGEKLVRGKAAIQNELERMNAGPADELHIENLISHGNICAANGVMKFNDTNPVAFCDVYTFSSHAKSAKIKKMTSYAIELK